MKRWTDIDDIKEGDIVSYRHNGYCSSSVEVLSINIVGPTYATMNWRWVGDTTNYYHTDFRKSEKIADRGMWHSLTTQMWEQNKRQA